jgi:hypothetical protein
MLLRIDTLAELNIDSETFAINHRSNMAMMIFSAVLCDLCASVVKGFADDLYRGDAENAENRRVRRA